MQNRRHVSQSAVSTGPIMLTKLRDILLTQYIGSSLIALLIWQGVFEFITTAVRSMFWSYSHRNTGSLLSESSSKFPWDNIVFTGVTIALYLLTAYALARWLFPEFFVPAAAEPKNDNDGGGPELQ